MSWPWSQLGLPGPSDLSEIRRAYAEKLKTTHPEDDPEGFQRLHSAYQLASRMARQQKRRAAPPRPEAQSPRREDVQNLEAPSERDKPEERDFDYEELLRDGGERPRRAQEDEEQDFDYEELLRDGGEQPRRAQEDEEQDFDYEELLRDGGEQARRAQEDEERDFDFERLFAEGEAERAEARRRRGEERRRAQAQAQARARERQKAQEWTRKREYWQRQEQRNTYDRERQDQFLQEQYRWQNTETILHTIEMMYNAGAGKEAWQKFFLSPLFQQTKGSLDLIFGLEDFVSSHPDLSRKVQTALFLAYGFDKGVSRPELRPLYQMLLNAWQMERSGERRTRWQKLWPMLAGAALVPISLLILTSDWLLGFVLLGALFLFGLSRGWFKRGPKSLDKGKSRWLLLWPLAFAAFTFLCVKLDIGLKIPLCVLAVGLACFVLREVFRLGRQEGKARGMPRNKRDERWLAAVTAVCLGIGIFMLFRPELEKGLGRLSDPREQVCQYLEEDFGIPFQSIYNRTELEKHSNVFAPEGDVGKMFLAGPDGERKDGQPGYTTNYPEMRMLWAIEDFAKAHNITGINAMDWSQGLEDWETSGTFLITLPFSGAGDTIDALGELLEGLSQETWYQVRTPDCEVVLCGKQMEEGRLILFRWKPEDGAFDTAYVRELYEESFAHAYCAQLLKECGLDRDFLHGGEEAYTLTNGGMAEMKGEACCKLFGVDTDGAAAFEYYVNIKGTTVYCVPGDFWETGGTEEQITFYQVLHWDGADASLGIVNLFYPWLRAVTNG